MNEINHSYTNSKWQEKVLDLGRMAPDWAHLTSLLHCLFHQVSYACSCLMWVVRGELREGVSRGWLPALLCQHGAAAWLHGLSSRPRFPGGARLTKEQEIGRSSLSVMDSHKHKLPLRQSKTSSLVPNAFWKVKWLLIWKSTLPCAANMFSRWMAAFDMS